MGGDTSILGDVYSYGVLLLEMFTGKRPTDEIFKESLNIHQYVKMALPERLTQIVDRSLLESRVEVETAAEEKDSENHSQINGKMENCLHIVLEIGVACSVESPKERMKMGEVIRELVRIKNAFFGFQDRVDRASMPQF